MLTRCFNLLKARLRQEDPLQRWLIHMAVVNQFLTGSWLGRVQPLPTWTTPLGCLSILTTWQLFSPIVSDIRESKMETASLLLSRLRGQKPLFPHLLFITQVSLIHCGEIIHKGKNNRGRDYWRPSWNLATTYTHKNYRWIREFYNTFLRQSMRIFSISQQRFSSKKQTTQIIKERIDKFNYVKNKTSIYQKSI